MDFESISAKELFTNSLNAFRNTLSPQKREEFQQFSSPEAMLAELRVYYSSSGNQTLGKCCMKVSTFAEKLKPYFDVVGAFVQTNPEYAGWFWGSTLLICKLGSNYAGFFEKTSEMLEQIAGCLPQYHDYVEIYRTRSDIRSDRLLKCLALVYADIIGFCQQIYTLLSGSQKSSKWRLRLAFVGEILWTPFQTRFGHLLERLKRHNLLFSQEAKLQDTKMIHAIQQSLNIHYNSLQVALDRAYPKADTSTQTVPSENMKKHIEHHIGSIKTWMGHVDYQSIYDYSKQHRQEGSGQWFLVLKEYTSWRDKSFEQGFEDAGISRQVGNIKILQAKPGFGKTFLSTLIIENLRACCLSSLGPSPVVAHFHFTRTPNLSSNDMTVHALRALVTQLVHLHREEPKIMDILAILKNEGSSGQLEASFEDARSTLEYLLRAHPTYLVVDGVDECRDHDVLLKTFTQLCRASDCKLLLLSRPDIVIPSLFAKLRVPVLNLTAEHNFEDIFEKVSTSLEELVDNGSFGSRPISPDAPLRAAKHANGMFLWAKLFMSYLRSTALSPKTRHRFLVDATNFNGLDGLIKVILARLNENSEEEKMTIISIFRWLAGSLYPLTNDALHTALAITPGLETTDLDYLSQFPGCLSQLTGALVEVDAFGRPAFIHISVKDYLVSAQSEVPTSLTISNALVVHEELASRCLSYIVHDVPKRPIWPIQPGSVTQVGTVEHQSSQDVPIRPVQLGDADDLNRAQRRKLLDNLDRAKRRKLSPGRSVRIPFQDTNPRISDNLGETANPPRKSLSYRHHDPAFCPPDFDIRDRTPLVHFENHHSSRAQNARRRWPQPPEIPRASLPVDRNLIRSYQKSVHDPVSGPPSTDCQSMTEDLQSSKYCFLRYATLCWVQHTWMSLSSKHRNSDAVVQVVPTGLCASTYGVDDLHTESVPQPLWIPHLSRLLLCKEAVTNWTESSFHYNMTPTLKKLTKSLKSLASEFPDTTSESREVHWNIHGVNQLSEALDELAKKYGVSLKVNPSLIWQQEITTASDPKFWPVWSNQEPSTLGPNTGYMWAGEPCEPANPVEDNFSPNMMV